MRELHFVGPSADGDAIVVECDGEHLRLPVDDAVRAAVSGRHARQMAIPLGSPLSPREIQHRIRHGEGAAQIAASSGVPIERVARFEGPVLMERAHQANRARAALVDGQPLGASVDGHLVESGLDPSVADWDSWRTEDGRWRVKVTWRDGAAHRSATWIWQPDNGRLHALDPLATVLSHQANDELTAVLRPLHGRSSPPPRPVEKTRTVRPPALPVEGPEPEPTQAALPAEPEAEAEGQPPAGVGPAEPEPPEHRPQPETAAEPHPEAPAETRPEAPAKPRPERRRKARPSVPSWDQISGRPPGGGA